MPHSLIIDEAARTTGIVHGKSFVLRAGADVWLVASAEEAPLASKRSIYGRGLFEEVTSSIRRLYAGI
eukprot:scaffold101343_cov67-Attheya_sp.AAC.2